MHIMYDIGTPPQECMATATNGYVALLRVVEEEQTPSELWYEAKQIINTTSNEHTRKGSTESSHATLVIADGRRQPKIT